MINKYGGSALRVPDGYRAFAALKRIVQNSYEKTHSIAVALDGPLGPRHETKETGILFIRACGARVCGDQHLVFFLYPSDTQMG